jgi:hypothetical protein
MLPLKKDEDIEIATKQIEAVQNQYEMTGWNMLVLYHLMKHTPEYVAYRDVEHNHLALNKFVLLLMHKHIHNAAINIEPKTKFHSSLSAFPFMNSTLGEETKPLVLGVKT